VLVRDRAFLRRAGVSRFLCDLGRQKSVPGIIITPTLRRRDGTGQRSSRSKLVVSLPVAREAPTICRRGVSIRTGSNSVRRLMHRRPVDGSVCWSRCSHQPQFCTLVAFRFPKDLSCRAPVPPCNMQAALYSRILAHSTPYFGATGRSGYLWAMSLSMLHLRLLQKLSRKVPQIMVLCQCLGTQSLPNKSLRAAAQGLANFTFRVTLHDLIAWGCFEIFF